jgi:hypothetical protein
LLLAYISIASAEIFEANGPDEVENFLEQDPAQYRALLFYDDADEDLSTNAEIDKIMSIFDNPDNPEFRGEPWIREIKTGATLMRIDIHKSVLSSVVTQYEAKDPPKIIVFDKTKVIVEETIGKPTYPKIKAEINLQNVAPLPPPTKTNTPPQTTPIPPSNPQPAPSTSEPKSSTLEPTPSNPEPTSFSPLSTPTPISISPSPPISTPKSPPPLPSQPLPKPITYTSPPSRPQPPPRPSVVEGK